MTFIIHHEETELYLAGSPIMEGEILRLHYQAANSGEVHLVVEASGKGVLFDLQRSAAQGANLFQIGTRGMEPGQYKVSVISAQTSQSRYFEVQ